MTKATALIENHHNEAPAAVPNFLYPQANALYVSYVAETKYTDISGTLVSGSLSLSTPPSRMPALAIFGHQKSCLSHKAMPKCQHLHTPRWMGSLFPTSLLLPLPEFI